MLILVIKNKIKIKMKTTLCILALLLFCQISYCQKESIKIEQLFITNKANGKSIKLFSSESTLKNFGDLTKVDTMFIGVEDYGMVIERTIINPDHFLRYRFIDIFFYVNTKNKISSFSTNSKNIAIEKKGVFSISPGNKFSDVARVFPKESVEAFTQTWGKNDRPYKTVMIQLSDYNRQKKVYVDIDYKICFLFNLETNTLEEMFIWICP